MQHICDPFSKPQASGWWMHFPTLHSHCRKVEKSLEVHSYLISFIFVSFVFYLSANAILHIRMSYLGTQGANQNSFMFLPGRKEKKTS